VIKHIVVCRGILYELQLTQYMGTMEYAQGWDLIGSNPPLFKHRKCIKICIYKQIRVGTKTFKSIFYFDEPKSNRLHY